MTTLTITRGLPGSGKTTWAKTLPAVRVNRDDLRLAIYGRYVLERAEEDVLSVLQQAAVRDLLESGHDVVVDDTNLNLRTVKVWQKIARETGAEFAHKDFEVSANVAIARVQQRARSGGRDVPRDVIERMHSRYLQNGFPAIKRLETVRCEPYVPDRRLPTAWIFDVDGTLTTGPKDRSPYEWHKVGQDAPRDAVTALFERLYDVDYDELIVVSGRDASCMRQTVSWLADYGVFPTAIHMRKERDMRRDDIVKAEIFDKHIRDNYHVLGVFDDRDQVVAFWRSIGLTCFQVEKGAF